MFRSTFVKINLENIKNNVKTILKKYNDYQYYFGVVKGDCYGHGSEIIDTLIQNGINYLAVSNLEEALDIREIHQNIPILCLQPISSEYLDICSDNNITLTIPSKDYCKELVEFQKKLTIHIKIDSGMSRLGFDNADDLKNCIKLLQKNKKINIEGIYTHMSTTGISDNYRQIQLNNFEKITSLIDMSIFKIAHIDKSATLLCQKKIEYCNGVRLGIILYGYAPSKITRSFVQNLKYQLKRKIYNIPETNYDELKLSPAFALHSKVIQIKHIKKDSLVGYGYTYKTKDDIMVATIEIGYADGINLAYRNNEVWINNKRYPIIGTINSGMISVQVDENVKLGDEVELFGEHISVKEVASKCNTTIYQLLTCISNKVPRIYK